MVNECTFVIEEATAVDARVLTDLTLRSKNYWNYGEEQIELWRAELTIDEAYFKVNRLFKLTSQGTVVGYYAYSETDDQKVKLDSLFIAPEYIGKGCGKVLLEDFLSRAKRAGFNVVTLDADPHAADFYAHFGFEVVGQLTTSIPHRFLPIMERLI